MATSVKEYLVKVEQAIRAGNATEHTYRPALKSLIESFDKRITATNEPKRERCGAPDFIVSRGPTPLGYIEAKDIGVNLDEVEKNEQMGRYFDGLSNLILTNYLEFRWYQNGEHVLGACLGRVGRHGRLRHEPGGEANFRKLIGPFLTSALPTVTSPRALADRMAGIARIIRDVIRRAFDDEDPKTGALHAQLDGFRRVLLHDLEPDPFADMYAQTICYGLFAARCNHDMVKGRFTRQAAAFELPETNPFLRKMFVEIAGPNLDGRLVWGVDHLAELLGRADMGEILADFGRRTRQEDPVVHFYETFLAAYDPAMREARGIYYTPEPVVSYIVRSVDWILKRRFKISDGLASAEKVPRYREVIGEKGEHRHERMGDCHKVLILDPAAGTGTFLHGIIDLIHQHVTESGQGGTWNRYVAEHLLPRLFGFELLMAPYAVAHMKLGLQLAQTGYHFAGGERLRVYLTNTLEKAFEHFDVPPFASLIAEEARAAGEIKNEFPVMVVLGNPPYSGHSVNKGVWIADLLRGKDSDNHNYFMVDGRPLGERNPKWLNDDYVKFIRFAQWRIERTGHGVLAFISNHGYLDNPTFRGMRQSLMKTFDDIHILDLHGNAKKKEKAPDGSKDENVFDIQQGVAIGLFVKRKNGVKKPVTVRHAHLWGLREAKYHYLHSKNVASTRWKSLTPTSPFYLFVPQDTELKQEYEAGWKITDMMPVNGVGMTTARDHMVIDFEKEPLIERAKLFRKSTESDAELCRQLNIPLKKGWNVTRSRQLLKEEKEAELTKFIRPVTYRPFDHRLIFYHDSIVWRTVRQVMSHMFCGNNVGLCTTRSIEIGRGWEHVFCTRNIIQHHTVSLKEVNYLFPLFLVMPMGEIVERQPNLTEKFVKAFSDRLDLAFIPELQGDRLKTFGPPDVFYYIYAIFHSPVYRNRYAEFLKIDFPRVPLTSNVKFFRVLCGLGERLAALHLMEATGNSITRYPESGSNAIEKVHYEEKRERVYINKTQFFSGVPERVWNFHIGGYQVCAKWLKDRRGRELSYDDLTLYQRIVATLNETIDLMAEIDAAIDRHGGWPIS